MWSHFGPQFGGELPGDIGVLGGVVGDFAHIFCCDVGHGRLAEQIVLLDTDERGDGHGRVAQVSFREEVHAVALLRLDQGMREHGVEIRPADLDAMREEHAEVEFEVVADFFDAVACEHVAEFFEHGLRGGFVTREVREPAFVCFPRERDADDVGVAWIESGRFEIEAEGFLLGELREEVLTFLGGLDEMINVRGVGDGGELCGDRRFDFRSREKIARRGFSSGFAATSGFEVIAIEPTTEGVELKLGEEGLQRVVIVRFEDEIGDLRIVRRIHEDGGELFGKQGVVLAGFEFFLLLAFELVGVGEQVFDAAVLLDERGGGFFAEAFHAGDVIDGVAHEREDVDDLLRALDAPTLADFLHAEDFDLGTGAAGFVDFDVLGDELAEVLVRCDHEGLDAFFLRAFGQDADDIVRLVAIAHEDGHVHGLHEAFDLRDGHADVLRHLLALRFVSREHLMARRGCGGVQSDREMRGLLILEDVEQRVGEAVERGGVQPIAGADGGFDEGKVRAVKQRHAVEKEEALGHSPPD